METTQFVFGAPESNEEDAQRRLVRDLDMISLADVLILSTGHFSRLGAALQLNGTAFSIKMNNSSLLNKWKWKKFLPPYQKNKDLPGQEIVNTSTTGKKEWTWPLPLSGPALLVPVDLS